MSIDISGRDGKVIPSSVTISIDSNHPLMLLASLLPWVMLMDMVVPDLKKTTKKGFWWLGRKLYVRIHLAVYLLQKLYDLKDRGAEYAVRDNAAYQLFCGSGIIRNWHAPDHTKIEEFRTRLSPETQRAIANVLSTHAVKLGFADPSKMDMDSTVQLANASYPSDANMLTKLAALGKKVYHHFLDQIPHTPEERFDLKKIKQKAKAYLFTAKEKIEEREKYFADLYWAVYFQMIKVTELNLAIRHIDAMPWNIRQAYSQIKSLTAKYFQDVREFMATKARPAGKIMSLHLKEVACFNKGKVKYTRQFGRAFQLGRIGGNFMIVGKSTTIRMEDKHAVKPMFQEHAKLFGEDMLHSFGADKGYFTLLNQRFLESMPSLEEFCLQRPGLDIATLSAEQQATAIRLSDRRSGIEPLIGHIKQGGQLGRSRMKNDGSTLAAGYGSVAGFNLRQLIRHQMGKAIKAM